jgi:outer membrane protein
VAHYGHDDEGVMTLSRFWRLLAQLSLWALLGTGLAAQAAPPDAARLGFVSLDKILRDSDPAKAAQGKLETEFAPRRRELADTAARLKTLYESLEKNASVLTDAERARRQKEFSDQDKDFQRRQREFNEDLNQRQNEEFAAVVDKANRVIRQIAENEKYDLIVQEAVYVNPRIDITDKVIALLNGQAAGQAAPAK